MDLLVFQKQGRDIVFFMRTIISQRLGIDMYFSTAGYEIGFFLILMGLW